MEQQETYTTALQHVASAQSLTHSVSMMTSLPPAQLLSQMGKLLGELKLMRGVTIDNERKLFFFQELCAIGYTQMHLNNARRWLLHGDWTFKGKSPVLEFADFFPTEAQLRSTATSCGFIVFSRQELEGKLQKVANQARQDAMMDFERHYKPVPPSERESELNNLLRFFMQEKNELKLENQKLIHEVATLRADLENKRREDRKREQELINDVKKRRESFHSAKSVLDTMKVA